MTRTLPQPISDPKRNLLLAMLDTPCYQSLMANAKIVPLKSGRRLYRQDEAVDAVYFPINCMLSVMGSSNGKGPALEMATVGREGVAGAIEALHAQRPLGVDLVQIPGDAVRVPAPAFLAESGTWPLLAEIASRHLHAMTRQIIQGAACNHLHTMEERCARSILTSYDYAGEETFPLTQEFLSHLLGVRRATVNQAVGALKKAGLISFVRGRLTVLDAKGLERISCECHVAMKDAYLSVMGQRETSSRSFGGKISC